MLFLILSINQDFEKEKKMSNIWCIPFNIKCYIEAQIHVLVELFKTA